MDSHKKQTQTNLSVSEQTGCKPDNGKADTKKQTDGKRNSHLPAGNYAQVMSVAKVALKNRPSDAELQTRRATISRELEGTNGLLHEVRSRIKDVPKFDEDDLAEYRAVLEARARDLTEKSALSEVEEDEDQEYEDQEYEDCEGEDSEDDEDDGVSICLKARPESLHEDSNSVFDDIEAAEETNSNLNANSDEDSDSDHGANLNKGKGIKADIFLNDECF